MPHGNKNIRTRTSPPEQCGGSWAGCRIGDNGRGRDLAWEGRRRRPPAWEAVAHPATQGLGVLQPPWQLHHHGAKGREGRKKNEKRRRWRDLCHRHLGLHLVLEIFRWDDAVKVEALHCIAECHSKGSSFFVCQAAPNERWDTVHGMLTAIKNFTAKLHSAVLHLMALGVATVV